MSAAPIVNDGAGQIGITLLPGRNNVSLAFAGDVAGKALQSTLSPLQWLQGSHANDYAVQVGSTESGFSIGEGGSDLFGNSMGIKLNSPLNKTGSYVGLGLYRGVGDTNPFSGVPATEAFWRVSSQQKIDTLMAADASWRIADDMKTKRTEFACFGGHNTMKNRMEGGLSYSAVVDRRTSLYSNVTSWNGVDTGYNWTLGGGREVGSAYVSLDNGLSGGDSSRYTEHGVSAIMPWLRGMFLARADNGVLEPVAGSKTPGSRSGLVFGSYSRLMSGGTTLLMDMGRTWLSNSKQQNVVSIGGQHELSKVWSVTANLMHSFSSHMMNVDCALTCAAIPTWKVSVIYEPSPFPATGNPLLNEIVGLQIVHTASFEHSKSGSLDTQVNLEGKPYSGGIGLSLDGQSSVATDKNGRLRIGDIEPGPHKIAIDLTTLPADIYPSRTEAPAVIVAGKTAVVDFEMQRVGEIRGNVAVLADPMGNIDPTAGQDVVISTDQGQATTTDSQDNFIIGNLPKGTYTVSLAEKTVPSDYAVIGPTSFTVTMDPLQPSPVVHFQIAPRKKVELAEIGGPTGNSTVRTAQTATSAQGNPAPSRSNHGKTQPSRSASAPTSENAPPIFLSLPRVYQSAILSHVTSGGPKANRQTNRAKPVASSPSAGVPDSDALSLVMSLYEAAILNPQASTPQSKPAAESAPAPEAPQAAAIRTPAGNAKPQPARADRVKHHRMSSSTTVPNENTQSLVLNLYESELELNGSAASGAPARVSAKANYGTDLVAPSAVRILPTSPDKPRRIPQASAISKPVVKVSALPGSTATVMSYSLRLTYESAIITRPTAAISQPSGHRAFSRSKNSAGQSAIVTRSWSTVRRLAEEQESAFGIGAAAWL
jgi:hypothetical protein